MQKFEDKNSPFGLGNLYFVVGIVEELAEEIVEEVVVKIVYELAE